jgi:hypothetical protein
MDRAIAAASECVEAYSREVASTKDLVGPAQCFLFLRKGLTSRPKMPFPGAGTEARLFMKYCLQRLNMFQFKTEQRCPVHKYSVRFDPVGGVDIPDESYIAWLVLWKRPNGAQPGEFRVLYNPARIRELCTDPWCVEKALIKVFLHECCHAVLHTSRYEGANPPVSATTVEENEAHRFGLHVLGHAVGMYSQWARETLNYDDAWRL